MSINFPQEGAKVLKRWKEIGAFERQVELSQGRPPYTFYDGPPFATGLPHYGHLLTSTIKDVIPRYWSMKGHYVERRFGWDTHGLPIEYEIDKKLGMSGKDAVDKLGIAKYNEECRAIVMTYAANGGSPSTSSAGSHSRRHIPPPQRPPRPASWHGRPTPWTLPSNIGLAAHPDFDYVKIADEASGKNYILLEALLKTIYKDPKKAKFKILERYKGKDMLGWEYEPLFPYFHDQFKGIGFKLLNGTYVTADSGTGIVHQSPAFGEEDYQVAFNAGVISAERLPPNPVDVSGCFTSEVPEFVGQHVKAADKAIIKFLKEKGRIVVDSQIMHSYPFCWRSDTPLIYKAVSTWFVKIGPIIPQMLENISNSQWVPAFVKDSRFASWIANARDWNISRNRYWGTPIPLWCSSDYSEIVCVGSIAELKELSGYEGDITDLHRDKVDHITIPSKKGNGPTSTHRRGV
ncbi:hypothetical protein MRB53_041085 [Persea americana]|nr:hypothetical protein MRB53_041085 [Persea americana]